MSEEVKFFIDGGLAMISMEVTMSTPFDNISYQASSTGYYWGTGGYFMLTKFAGLGVVARVSSADVDFGRGDVAAGGTHIAATISFFLE